MMTNQFDAIKRFFPEKLKCLQLVASILLLLLPCYSWFLFRLHQTIIQIPQEWKQFKVQEEQIIQGLQEFRIKNQEYPEFLSTLESFLDFSLREPEKWSFRYNTDGNSKFFLSANVPNSWFGWPARRVCRSQQNELVECNFHFVCRYKQGIEFLTEPIGQEQPIRQFLRKPQTNPCSSQD